DGGPVISPLVAAPGVTISEVALYQAVKVDLMIDGKPAPASIPITAGRDALLRVFLKTDASFTGKALTARLFLDEKGLPMEVMQTLSGSSSDDKLDSTLNFDVPGDKITPTTKYKVFVGVPLGSASSGAAAPSYPASGFDPIPAESIGDTLKIMLAPIAYGPD